MIAGTAQAWLEAIVTDRTWERDRDQPRFEAAFVILARTAKRWPTVADLLEALPRPPEQQRLMRPTDMPETREERCERLRKLLGDAYNPATADPDYDPTKAHRSAVSIEEKRAAEEALALRTRLDQDAEELP